jgi:hypothetical protein
MRGLTIGKTFDISRTANELVPEKSNRAGYILALLTSFFIALMILILAKRLPKVVPLWYTEPWGEGRLVPQLYLYILPGSIFVVTFLNMLVAKMLAVGQPLLRRMLATGAALFAGLILLAFVGVIQSLLLW